MTSRPLCQSVGRPLMFKQLLNIFKRRNSNSSSEDVISVNAIDAIESTIPQERNIFNAKPKTGENFEITKKDQINSINYQNVSNMSNSITVVKSRSDNK